MTNEDIPSPIDLRLMADALQWERGAMERPFREEFFQEISDQLIRLGKPDLNLIDLGSGPGFLAGHLLTNMPKATLTLLDYSSAMHVLARDRLSEFTERVRFVERDFKELGWQEGLGTFDAVLTVQAVHELRHKRHAYAFHRTVRELLRERGIYLICDHYCGDTAMQNNQLFMSLPEQRACLREAGYCIQEVLVKGGRSLFLAS